MTHPFHPLSGRQLVCVGERYNRYGTRLLLRVDDDRLCSLPRQWTDVVGAEPEVVIGGGRVLFRVADLLELAGLVSRLVEEGRRRRRRKGNHAAMVKETTPLAAYWLEVHAAKSGFAAHQRATLEVDSGAFSGIIEDTQQPEIACQGKPTPKKPRRQRSTRKAR